MSTLRNAWRQLTSMRTALVLLFLLALAAIPGSVLPQRTLGPEKVAGYFRQHPDLAPWLDRFQLFGVYSSVWFSAIYLLLFTSLVGCVVPRLRTHIVALIRVPPQAPSRLNRLPAHADGLEHDGDLAATAQRLRRLLRSRRFRVVVRPESSGGFAVSGEKGYLKESGNLLFHFALLGLLVGVAAGASFGWHGNRIVVAGAEQGFCNTIQQYDEFARGGRIGVGDLPRFCVSLVDFQASYLDSGQPVAYRAVLRHESGTQSGETRVEVNHPLRMPDANVYLLGHGYAPVVRYTDRAGRSQTTVAPFLPIDGMLTSTGVAAFPDANVGASASGPKAQVAFSGVYLPTAPADVAHGVSSVFPAERDPRLVVQAYVGDLGLDAGIPQSVYEINMGQVRNGQLHAVGDLIRLKPGESFTLPDGSRVEFIGTRQWAALSVRHDPGERFVLAGAVLLVIGLLASLTGRRRRVFFRVTDDGVNAGGLPRGDYPGFDAEFESIVRASRGKGRSGDGRGDDGRSGDGRSGDGGAIGPAARGDDSGVSGGDAVLRG